MRSKMGIDRMLPKLFVGTSILSLLIVEGILYGKKVNNQKKL